MENGKIILIDRGDYMYTFFPVIHNDELLFSIYARYHERSLSKNERQTLEKIGLTKLHPLLPESISRLTDELGHFDAPNIEYFLNFHTLYNYFSNFISFNEKVEIYQYIFDGSGKVENYVLNKLFSRTPYLKYCPDCSKIDFEILGESYWRVSHQPPTVFVCQIHHILLEQLNVSNYEIGLKTVTLTETHIVSNRTLTKKTMFFAMRFLQQSVYLNKLNLKLYNKTQSQDFYQLLKEKGFLINSEIDVKKLEREIIEFFGIEFLELVGFNQGLFEEMANSPLFFSNSMAPIEILVFINFFFESLSGIIIYHNKIPKRELVPSLLAEILMR